MRFKRLRVGLIVVTVVVMVAVVGLRSVQADNGPTCQSDSHVEITAIENCGGQLGIYGIEMRAIIAEMAAHPVPEVTPLPIDEKMLNQRAYRKVIKETDVYNAP